MRELWILLVSATAAYFWTAELWRGNVWGAALILGAGFLVSVSGVVIAHFWEVIWRRLVK